MRWLRAHSAAYNLDPNRFGAWGASSGAHLADVLALCDGPSCTVGNTTVDMQGNKGGNLSYSDRVQAVCAYFTPSDLLRMDNYPTPSLPNHNATNSPESLLLGATVQTVPELAGTANPLVYVHTGAPPFLLIHGSADGTVTFNQSELLYASLLGVGADVTFYPNYNANHGSPSTSWSTANITNAVYGFFDRTLKNITTNMLPVPVISSTSVTGSVPFSVTFYATNSYDSDGAISLYAWSFGDDTGGGNVTSITHTYTNAGTYTATLCVMDNHFGVRSTTRAIVVNQPLHFPLTNTAPQITLTSPSNNSVQLAPGSVYLQAAVIPGNSAVTNVQFAVDNFLLGQDLISPYGLAIGNLSAGHHTAVARATDTNGLSSFSAAVGFDVLPDTSVSTVVNVAGTNYFAVQFHRIPAATNLTCTVDVSTNLTAWVSGSIYSLAGDTTNTSVTAEFSRAGTHVETITVRDVLPLETTSRNFLRVRVTAQ